MTGQAWVGDSIKVWREAAHMAASLTLLQITSVDLVNPQIKARLFLSRGLARPESATIAAMAAKQANFRRRGF